MYTFFHVKLVWRLSGFAFWCAYFGRRTFYFILFLGGTMKTSTNPTTIKNAKHYFKTARKISTAICAICILLSVLFLMSSCCCCCDSFSTVEDGRKEDVEEYLAQKYDEVGSTSELEVKEISDGMWSVTGPIYVYRYNFGTQVKEAIRCDVDFRFKEENSSYTMVSQNIKETKDPSKNGSVPSAISKIDTEEALEKAEKELKSRLKNPSSYQRHDYTVTAKYDSDGDINVTVMIDYSAQNGFGGMNRELYFAEFTCSRSSGYSTLW